MVGHVPVEHGIGVRVSSLVHLSLSPVLTCGLKLFYFVLDNHVPVVYIEVS